MSDAFLNWMVVTLPRMHLSCVSLYEIEQGIRKLERSGSQQRAAALSRWVEHSIGEFGERLLSIDGEVARAAGRLSDRALERGVHPGAPDILIAATAVTHGLTLLTYNMKHFGPLDIGAVDPSGHLPR